MCVRHEYGKESVTKTGRLYIIFITVLYSKQKKDDIEWWNRRLRVWIVVVERDYDGKKNRRGGGKTQQYTITITRTYNNTLITIWYWFGDMWFVFRELLTSSLPIWWISIDFLFFFTNIGNLHGYLSPYGAHAITKIDNLLYNKIRVTQYSKLVVFY